MKQLDAIILIGLPGSGKSTHCHSLQKSRPDLVRISTDIFIGMQASHKNITYNQAFEQYFRDSESYCHTMFRYLVHDNSSFIWDQTNLLAAKRRDILSQIPSTYRKIGYYFDFDPDTIRKRLFWREQANPSKIIPEHLFNAFAEAMEEPTLDEGFDQLFYVGSDIVLVPDPKAEKKAEKPASGAVSVPAPANTGKTAGKVA